MLKIRILTLGKIYSSILAFVPLILYMKVPFTDMSMTSILIPILAIILFFLALLCKKKYENNEIVFLSLFLVYMCFRQGGDINRIVLFASLLVIFYFSTQMRLINIYILQRTIIMISYIAALLLIVQVVLHFLFGFHLQLQYLGWLNSTMIKYEEAIKTGMAGGLYRPSAFFMEPAHFSEYSSVALILLLFNSNKKNMYNKAIVITIGVLCSTSGMGIIFTGIIWGIYILISSPKARIYFLICAPVLLSITYLLYTKVDFFVAALTRVIDGSALRGRTFWWNYYISQMNSRQIIWGATSSLIPEDRYFTGSLSLFYAYGGIGISLLMLALIQFCLKNNRTICRVIICGLYVGLLLVANMTNSAYMLFYFTVMLATGRCNIMSERMQK